MTSEKEIIQEARDWIASDLTYFESLGDRVLCQRGEELLNKLDRILANRKAINED